ncbi:fimbrial protein [Acinetobacter baumannii]|uniref:fimbrial protein n=1 Tax=Acinetobacter baumannii TaxID=470 RepID=UPI000D68A419|nr:fimbrial protein [Acinetobacter baumannii]MBD0532052.1 type 1 fimbrial protein [Acinetobacter baumannii]MCZ3264350.1 type 1 fimbrial protein [Acinetobacter baumannii]MCZ3345821.1 type 1 fimbrial protein [Acinetobacter baumannii]MDA4856043.1 fimbrial protein [Acinetobacter baumannii]MDI9751952.1 fimbrial protein [Acinetobacter baumannii]
MKSTIAHIATVFTLVLSTQCFADAGAINFKGNVVASACDITVNGTSSADINLGTWPTSTFKNTGDKSSPQPFKLEVSKCNAGTYQFAFIGTADSDNPNLFKVSSAKGVGIGIATADGQTDVKINTTVSDSSNASLTTTGGEGAATGTLNLQAFYEATGASVSAGDANANVRVTLQLK